MEIEPPEQVENPICLHCAAELTGHEHFCAKCGCPVTPMAASLPYESILARGFAAREGSSRPRKFIVVLGMWIMFGPMFAIFTFGFFAMLFASQGIVWQENRHREIPGNLFGIAVSAALASIAGTLLYRTTRNYLEFRSDMNEKGEDDDQEEDSDEVGAS
jgi:hypothetical protein